MRAVGYAEVAAHVRGEIAREELELAIVRATKTFARRQRTWLAKAPVERIVP
jgi:tRNA dimethylallyltransferase